MFAELFDLTKFITDLVGYAYYAGWVVVGVSVILSIYYFAFMHDSEKGKRSLTFTIAAAAVLIGGFAAVTSIGQAPNLNFPGAQYVTLFAYAGVALTVVAAAVNFATQRPDRALAYLAAGVIIFAALAAGALVQPNTPGLIQPAYITATVNPASCTASCTVTISGTLAPQNYNPAQIAVAWGDNTTSSTTTNSNGLFTIKHTYNTAGSYTIQVTAYTDNQTATAEFFVQINKPQPWYAGIVGDLFHFLESGFTSAMNGLIGWIGGAFNTAFDFLVLMPVFGGSTWPGSVMSELYSVVERYSLGLVGVFVLADVLWTVFWKGAEDIEETVIRFAKEVIVVLLVIFTAPLFYNALAYVLNPLTAYMIHIGSPGTLVSAALGFAAGLAAASILSPALGVISGLIIFSIILMIVLAFIRFLVIGGFLVTAPLLAVLWLFPPLRRVVDFAAEIMIGLTIMGVIAAAVIGLLGTFVNQAPIGDRIPLYIASPVLIDTIPVALSFLTLGGAGNIFGGWGGRIASLGRTMPTPMWGMPRSGGGGSGGSSGSGSTGGNGGGGGEGGDGGGIGAPLNVVAPPPGDGSGGAPPGSTAPGGGGGGAGDTGASGGGGSGAASGGDVSSGSPPNVVSPPGGGGAAGGEAGVADVAAGAAKAGAEAVKAGAEVVKEVADTS